jgi:non-specific serine/threonine protein kinase
VELIGRDAELTRVADRLRERRLVTLVGPGGIGKTALARAVVDRCEADYDVGSHTVDLTLVDSADAVRESVASQLGYRSFRALIDAPGDLSVLLFLDNCEHVVDAAAEAVDELLTSCQMPTVLATSRRVLRYKRLKIVVNEVFRKR